MSDSTGFLSTLTRHLAIRLVALGAALVQAGCYVTEIRPMPTPIVVTDTMVVHWNERDWTLFDARLEGDSVLVGTQLVQSQVVMGRGVLLEQQPDAAEVRLPVVELHTADRRLSGGRTALFVVGGVVGALAMLGMIVAQDIERAMR